MDRAQKGVSISSIGCPMPFDYVCVAVENPYLNVTAVSQKCEVNMNWDHVILEVVSSRGYGFLMQTCSTWSWRLNVFNTALQICIVFLPFSFLQVMLILAWNDFTLRAATFDLSVVEDILTIFITAALLRLLQGLCSMTTVDILTCMPD